MQRLFNNVVILGVLTASMAVGTAQAQSLAGAGNSFEFWFDENGNGTISVSGGPSVPNPGFLSVEPISGMTTLTYTLPEPVGTGDVRIWEDSITSQILSDVLRFGGPNHNLMWYFSDIGDPDLADVGLPDPLFPADGGGVVEVGPEGDNGFTYVAGDNIYHGISDAPRVPDAGSSLLLACLSLLGLAGLRVFNNRLAARA